MLYIKKIVLQDKKKEYAMQFGPSVDFFHIEPKEYSKEENSKRENQIKIKFLLTNDQRDDESLKKYDGYEFTIKLHYNGDKKETRSDASIKNFIFDKVNLDVDDLVVLKRKETTSDKFKFGECISEADINLIRKSDKNDYAFYSKILAENQNGNQKNYECIAVENESNITENIDGMEYNVIYYGAPGTGKSYTVDKICKQNRWIINRITFHPETDYYSFVGSYKPQTDEDNSGKILYKYSAQIFLKTYLDAWFNQENKYCLVIEEINRGNCAQIFGDIFQLLDRSPDGNSTYTVDVEDECAAYIKEYFENNDPEGTHRDFYRTEICKNLSNVSDFSFSKLMLPGNLYIYATMNTSDQSLYPMDSAFKRRWSWEYVPINYEDDEVLKAFVLINNKKYKWSDFLKKINMKIEELTQSEDKKLGTRFIPLSNPNINSSIFRDKVLFYLWNDVFKDEYGTSQTIFKSSDQEGKSFLFSSLFSTSDWEMMIEHIMKNLEVECFEY